MSSKPTTSNLLLLLLICWSSFGSVSAAQEIRWKFSADDEFLVTQKQTTNMETLVEKRKSILGSSVELSAAWKVISVEGDVALVDQTIESIKINIDNPADNTKSVAIDTASDTRPAKNSRELLKQLQPLVGMVFQLKLNTRGEVLSVDVPDETKKRLDAIPTDSWLKALLDPGKLQGQIQSSSLPLPETELKKGQSVAIEPPANRSNRNRRSSRQTKNDLHRTKERRRIRNWMFFRCRRWKNSMPPKQSRRAKPRRQTNRTLPHSSGTVNYGSTATLGIVSIANNRQQSPRRVPIVTCKCQPACWLNLCLSWKESNLDA